MENTILIGLGGTGGKILRAIKKRMFEEYPTAEQRSKLPVSYLYIDSTTEMMPKDGLPHPEFKVMGQDASFTPSEFYNIKSVDISYILDHIEEYTCLNNIVDNVEEVRNAIGALGEAAGQKRRAGRILFAVNARGYVNALQNAYARSAEISGEQGTNNIYIFAGLSGGTGSGSIIDVIVQTRKTYPNANIMVYAMIPEMTLPKPNMNGEGRYYPNGYAALKELNALQMGVWEPQDVTGNGRAKLYQDRRYGVADGLSLYSNVNEHGLSVDSLKELPKLIGDVVFHRVFHSDATTDAGQELDRAFKYENCLSSAMEFDELASPETAMQHRIRTKKINIPGIKRIMYPEMRILKHITYTTGERVLRQFKYNNWQDGIGYKDEEPYKDYRATYLNQETMKKWMLDETHLLLERKILNSDPDYQTFDEYWKEQIMDWAETAMQEGDNALTQLDHIINEIYKTRFQNQDCGVEDFYNGKRKAINDMANAVRYNIEQDLFSKWLSGDVSIIELVKVSKLLIEKIGEIRGIIDTNIKEEEKIFKDCKEKCEQDILDYKNVGVFNKFIMGKKKDIYAEYQTDLQYYYASKTRMVALDFAKALAAKIETEIIKMNSGISNFAQEITDTIKVVENLINEQRKINKGLEDMKGAIIEVCEEEAMSDFEKTLTNDLEDMKSMSKKMREAILPKEEFKSFGHYADLISIEDFTDAFDLQLSTEVKIKHDQIVAKEEQILGLNIIAQLMQQIHDETEIKQFAHKIVHQSGTLLGLAKDELGLPVRNNLKKNLMNGKVIYIAIPKAENEQQQKFVQKLQEAIKNSIPTDGVITNVVFEQSISRHDEIAIIEMNYCMPMRTIEWLKTYKQRYEEYLKPYGQLDRASAILLHGEGTGEHLPDIFALSNKEVERILEERKQKETPKEEAKPAPQPTPSVNSAATNAPKPKVNLYVGVNGQPSGPYDWEKIEALVEDGTLTKQSLVWGEGMSAWMPAGQVEVLQPLFMPKMPPMPQMPPMPNMPPMPPTM